MSTHPPAGSWLCEPDSSARPDDLVDWPLGCQGRGIRPRAAGHTPPTCSPCLIGGGLRRAAAVRPASVDPASHLVETWVADDEEIALAGLGLTADEGPQALRAMTSRYSLPRPPGPAPRLTANHSGALSAAKTPT